MKTSKEVIKLGFCPRCKEQLEENMMKKVVRNVEFCYLCGFDLTDIPNDPELGQWVRFAKEYKKEMM
jgi:hypothetical protein